MEFFMSQVNDGYKIHALPLCTVDDFPRSHLHWMLPVPFDVRVRDCHYVWYIEGLGDKYLIDAGISAERFVAKKRKSTHIQTLDEALGGVGLEVGDIDYVIVSHAHHDHIANLRCFPKAKAIIQRAELEEAHEPFHYSRPRLPTDYADLLMGIRWEVVEGDTRIDDNVELLFTPGHSAGGQSVAVKTSKGLAVVTGFCCQQENFDPPDEFKKMGYPFTICHSHINPVALYDSTKRLTEMADIIIPCHEYEKLVGTTCIG